MLKRARTEVVVPRKEPDASVSKESQAKRPRVHALSLAAAPAATVSLAPAGTNEAMTSELL